MANPFVHLELNASDLRKAKKFYKALFDWKLTDSKEMQYTMIDVGKGTGGGMWTNPQGAPGWLAYVEVDSVKKTIAKAKKAGAKIFVEYMPIGAMGAIGVFADPNGATLGVWETAKAPTKKAATKKAATKKKAAPKKKAAKK